MKVTASDIVSLAQDVADLTTEVERATALEGRYRAQAQIATANAERAAQEACKAAYGLECTLEELAAAAE